ncbi:MAG: hypothetical protein CK532_01125 [Flavobacteriales bacterium]|nr:MAG: hypothetical protein CK532_01125 [Flavobacteriales bacterium]
MYLARHTIHIKLKNHMNTHYKIKHSVRFFKQTALLIFLSLAGVASAQMSGSYTINSASSTGGTNFANWADLASELSKSGVSGAVKVAVSSNITTSTQTAFAAISGSSSTNTITIDGISSTRGGSNAILSFNGSYEAIAFKGADYVTIKNVTIGNSTTASYAGCVRFSNGSDYNTIDNCVLEFSALTSAVSGTYYLAISYNANPAAVSSVTSGSYNTISNNTMRTTASSSAGPFYGMVSTGNSSSYSSTAENNTFSSNKVQNFYQYGIYNMYSNGDQFTSNDFSRANASSNSPISTALTGIYSYYTYGKSRSTSYTGNNFHDLPYSGASSSSTTNYISNFTGAQMVYNYGTTKLPVIFEKNIYKDIFVYSYATVVNGLYNSVMDYNNNTIDNLRAYSGTVYMFYVQYGNDADFIGNTVKNCKIGEGSTAYLYHMYLYNITNSQRTRNQINDNVFIDNYYSYFMYGIYLYYGNYDILRNRMLRNNSSTSQGYMYGMMFYYLGNYSANSNIMADNLAWYGNYNIYTYSYQSGYKVEWLQNTVHYKVPSNGYSYHFAYGIVFQDYASESRFNGNIADFTTPYYVYGCYLYSSPSSNIKSCKNNTFWVSSPNQYWCYGTNGYNTYGDWRGSTGNGPGNNYVNPNWKDISAGKDDWRSDCFETQNDVNPANGASTLDQLSALRNKAASDRGSRENMLDAEAVKTDFSIAKSVCAGHETVSNIYIKNNFIDTIYNFYVAYSINGKATRQLVKDKILSGATLKVDFVTPISLTISGQTSIKIYLDIPDDKTSNDTLSFSTLVKPAPGGGSFEFSTKTSTPNTAIYQSSRPYDITVLDIPVIYDVKAPRVYSNSSYGSAAPNNWYATVQAYTPSGKAISGATLTAPSGTTNLEVQYKTSDANMEDSMLLIILKVTDNNNGCDTFIKRKVLIYPSIKTDYTYPTKICNGDDVPFVNTSKVKSGSMDFFWDFGTGSKADTSNAPEPIFRFPKAGKYPVLLTAKTLPNGFIFTQKYDVEVFAIPTVAFDKVNACLGNNLVFTNKTSPINAKFKWDFGNGTTATTTDAKVKYPKAGTYYVSLSADLNGCIAMFTSKVYQFEKPVAKYVLKSGVCDNNKFAFTNNSTIGAGLIGNFWNFDDNGSVSTDENPIYTFSKHGKKQVKLVVSSEFGCTDSMTKEIEVRESPKVAFTNTPACSLTPTIFTNTTPDVAGAVANYSWNFGDGTTSKTKSPSKSWTNLGPKKIILSVTLDNGCKDEITKDISVATQPKTNFSSKDVCAGDPVVFENGTSWPQGEISYKWDFGDNTYSTNSDPSKLYNIIQTTSYNVTLYAYILDGCSDSITQRVTVNESPRTCDFKATPDYAYSFFGVKVEPVNASGVAGGQNNIDYTWIFAGGGTLKSKDLAAAVNYDLQSDGEYTVTMKALVRQTGCECTKIKKIVMNRAATKDLLEVGVAVYPNPTSGDIKVATSETFGANITVNVMSITGKVVYSTTSANQGVMVLNAGDLSNGIYLVQVTSGNNQVTRKITVQK